MRPLGGWDGRQARADDRRLVDPGLPADLTGTSTAGLFVVVWFVLPRPLSHRGSPARARPAGRRFATGLMGSWLPCAAGSGGLLDACGLSFHWHGRGSSVVLAVGRQLAGASMPSQPGWLQAGELPPDRQNVVDARAM